MLSAGRYFPEQAATDEPVVLFVRRHWFAFMSWILLLSVMVVSPLVVMIALGSLVDFQSFALETRTLMIVALSIYYLFVLAVFIVAWLDFYLDVTIVTPRRLVDIHQNGLFNHQVSEQSLLRVQDVSVRVEGPFQTLFGFGTVYVETAGEAPNFVMRNLPRPNQIANTVLELHHQMVEQGYLTTGIESGDE